MNTEKETAETLKEGVQLDRSGNYVFRFRGRQSGSAMGHLLFSLMIRNRSFSTIIIIMGMGK